MTRLLAPWITQPASRAVTDAFEKSGHQIFFVGGCVRNTLMERAVSDIDLATDATPEEMIALGQQAGLRTVPTGIDHGTITFVVDKIPFEVTTFRTDVSTDGRRATVAFSKSLAEDARRRDFTMNALYVTPNGEIHDPVGGLEDLARRHVRFIEHPRRRITEDYLRILRFFRFHAWYGDPHEGLDPEGLAACAELAQGLDALSRERIGSEMRKLLAADDPAPSVASMDISGVLSHVLPGADPRVLTRLVHLEASTPPSWQRRAAALGGEDPCDRWRLSRADARMLTTLRALTGSPDGIAATAYRHGAQIARDTALVRAATFEQPLPEDLHAMIKMGAKAVFPVVAADLMPDLQGAELGSRLKDLETRWIASGFALSKEELLR
ncbi:MAG: CCA tRNA nucleotidyltransferase [Litoreibacter sp.]|nr:CCA tRNA nucleotidyltransferase [Litoreibacter sp.]